MERPVSRPAVHPAAASYRLPPHITHTPRSMQYAVPGGLIGVGLTIDPTLTRADRLVGQVLGEVGNLPDVFSELEINFFLLRRLLGVRAKEGEKAGKVGVCMSNCIFM